MDLKYYQDKRVLITGVTGYIGSKLLQILKNHSKNIIGLNSSHDLTDQSNWRKWLKETDIIFHLAAQTSLTFANNHPVDDLQINLLPLVTLIQSCLRFYCRPDVVFAGTVTQVGLTNTFPVNEKFIDKPITIYDIHKLTCEKYLQYYTTQIGGRAISLRLANVYGPSLVDSQLERGIVNQMITKSLNNQPLTIFGSGKYIRDYVYIDDVIDAFLLAGKYIKRLNGSYYIIASGKAYTIKQMVELIQKAVEHMTKKHITISYRSFPPTGSPIEQRNFVGNPSAFNKITGWKASINLSQGIKNTINHYLKQSHS